jgi:ligand-binding sensor domain-containing protein
MIRRLKLIKSKSIKIHLSLIIIVFYTCGPLCMGQEKNLRFQHFTSDQGLSQNTVDGILQDSRGFMWFATWNGLNRYDGYNFVVYKSDNSSESLSNNFIYSICEDKEGNIWVATRNGLNRLRYTTNQFTRFFHDPENLQSIASNRINVVYCDHLGNIWAGTADSGLDRIVVSKNGFTITHYKTRQADPASIPENEINAICEDHQGNIWVGTNSGLGKLNISSSKFITYVNNPFMSVPSRLIT